MVPLMQEWIYNKTGVVSYCVIGLMVPLLQEYIYIKTEDVSYSVIYLLIFFDGYILFPALQFNV